MTTKALAFLVLLASSVAGHAQILYTTFNGSTFQLRVVNPDGSGDSAVATPFTNLAFPAWSRDRALIALTATDPARPSQISLNAFTFNPANGAIQNVTNFEDNLTQDKHTITYAYHKAFSPNRQFMAVNSVISSGSASSSSDTPILQIFATDGSGGSLATVHVGFFKDGIHHDGEGITWSPTQNVLATPVKIDTPLQSTAGKGETTAIFLAEPVTNAGNARQLTFPHADQVATPTQGYVYGEHDYQPKFSPNGASVAYVRSFQIAYTSNGGVPSPDVQTIRIVDVNTGAETQVIQLQQGLYVTTLDWSPDGTALVFDAGQQYVSSGIPAQVVQPGTDHVYIINVDGNGLRELRGAGSGQPAWAPSPLPPSQLANISTRMRVLTGDNALIGGFILTGSDSRKVIIRGLGPSLPVAGALADPTLELHQGNTTIATNNNWRDTQQTEIQQSTIPPTKDLESAIVQTLAPGPYTAILRGQGDSTGIGLVEVYDLSTGTASKVANISTRGFVDTGDNAMIGGLIIGNGGGAKVIIRGLGPSLPVGGALQDPTLELHDSNGATIAANDNWQTDSGAAEIQADKVNPADARESALLRTLAPGSYTAILRGSGNTTGVGLVEVYNVQ